MGTIRQRILDAIRASAEAGMTIDEIATQFGLLRSTARARLSELHTTGLIRPGESGHERPIWVVAERGYHPPVSSRGSGHSGPIGKIKGLLRDHIERSTEGVPALERERILKEAEREVDQVMAYIANRVHRSQAAYQDLSGISRRRLVPACHLLGVTPPRTGRPVDLKRALSSKRAAVRTYHPDAPGGGNREVLAQILAAYDTLVLYNDSLVRPAEGLGPAETKEQP